MNSMTELREIAGRLAAKHATRIACPQAAREIEAALQKVAQDAYAIRL